MRGSSTAGCIRGMERVSQGDSAATHEFGYGPISTPDIIEAVLMADVPDKCVIEILVLV